MDVAVSALGAVLPSLLLLRYFYNRDLYPEPHRVLLGTFFLGGLIAVPVIVVTVPMLVWLPLPSNAVLYGLVVAFVCAAIPEEFFKYLVVTRYCARHPAFDEPMDGVVYGVTVSLGFATLENILYVAGGGWTIALVRAFTAVPMHAFLGAILGYFVGQARFHPQAAVPASRGLWLAIILHGLYDFGLLTVMQMAAQGTLEMEDPPGVDIGLALGMLLLSLAVLLLSGGWTWLIVHNLRREQIVRPPEPPAGYSPSSTL